MNDELAVSLCIIPPSIVTISPSCTKTYNTQKLDIHISLASFRRESPGTTTSTSRESY